LPGGITFTGIEMFQFIGSTGNDSIIGGDYDDSFYSKGGHDIFRGEGGNDYLSGSQDSTGAFGGGDGNDYIVSYYSGDTIYGGAGTGDQLSLSRALGAGTFTLKVMNAGTLAIASDGTRIHGIETFNINLTGAGSRVELHAGGADQVFGTAGGDTIKSFDGGDVLSGRDGADRLFGGNGNDALSGGDGVDFLSGGEGDDYLSNNNTAGDTLDGGAGRDMALISAAGTAAYDFALGNGSVTLSDGTVLTGIEQINFSGGTSNDRVAGGALNDALYGFDGKDTLGGGAGNDTIIGGTGYDRLFGGDGNDFIYDTYAGDASVDDMRGGNGNDSINLLSDGDVAYGGSGNDMIFLYAVASTGSYDVVLTDGTHMFGQSQFSGFERMTYVGIDGNDSVRGGDRNDVITGGGGADTLQGAGGNDVFFASADNVGDRYIGGTGSDTVAFQTRLHAVIDLVTQANNSGAATLDTFSSIETFSLSPYDDVFRGDAGNNRVFGGSGGDRLNGGDGDDLLVGGQGADDLNGGAGKDIFGLDYYNNGPDDFTDFTKGEDKIGVDASAFDDITSIVIRNGVNPVASGSAVQFLFDTDEHTLWVDFDGAGDDEAYFLAHIGTVNTLSVNDFVFTSLDLVLPYTPP